MIICFHIKCSIWKLIQSLYNSVKQFLLNSSNLRWGLWENKWKSDKVYEGQFWLKMNLQVEIKTKRTECIYIYFGPGSFELQ